MQETRPQGPHCHVSPDQVGGGILLSSSCVTASMDSWDVCYPEFHSERTHKAPGTQGHSPHTSVQGQTVLCPDGRRPRILQHSVANCWGVFRLQTLWVVFCWFLFLWSQSVSSE